MRGHLRGKLLARSRLRRTRLRRFARCVVSVAPIPAASGDLLSRKSAPFFRKIRLDSGSCAKLRALRFERSAMRSCTGNPSLRQRDCRVQSARPTCGCRTSIAPARIRARCPARPTARQPSMRSRVGIPAASRYMSRERFAGRALAKIDERGAAVGETDQHESAAAQVPGVGMRHGQREADRDRRVHGVAAVFRTATPTSVARGSSATTMA